MRSITLGSSCLLAVLACASFAHGDDIRTAIEEANRVFVETFAGADGAKIAELYTEDAMAIPPGAPPANGRTAIAALWQGAMDDGLRIAKLTTVDVESAGDLAAETGRAQLVDKQGAQSEALYVVVWKRQAGRWLLHRDIWNSR